MDRFWVAHSSSSTSSFNGVISSERMDSAVFCPMPRRVGQLNGASDWIRPHRLQLSVPADRYDSGAATEIFDLTLTKDWYGGQDQLSGSLVSSSPPYFCGSPPTRAANPIVHDARFLEEKHNGHSPLTPTSPMSPSTASTARKGGCSRPSTAKVRVEGFDCLNRDIGGHGIPAVA